VYCPRCGTPNEPDDRFCSSCGSPLQASPAPKEHRSFRTQAAHAFGTTRKARLISLATAAALTIAIVALISLKPSGDSGQRDAYTVAADRLCLDAKHRIVAVEQRSTRDSGTTGTGSFAAGLVPVVETWRLDFGKLRAPADRIEAARDLNAALLAVEIQIARLARAASLGVENKTLAAARSADESTATVEKAVAALDLTDCAQATIGLPVKQG